MRRMLLVLALLLPSCDKKDDDEPSSAAEAEAKAEAKAEGLDPFTEYKRKSIASEAKVNIARLGDGLAAYYHQERPGPDGTIITQQVPPAAPITPPIGECCKQPDRKCASDESTWSAPGFVAADFQITDPHYYSYSIEVDGDQITVKAHGDLDCDGTLSTYSRMLVLKDGEIDFAFGEPENPLE